MNGLPDYGQQLIAKGGRLHPDVERAIANGGGWPSGVPIPDPLTLREQVGRLIRRLSRRVR